MSSNGVDVGKRRFLTLTGVAAGGVGAAAAAWPFLASLAPSERAKALGAPVTVDISKLQEGQLLITTWRGSPVWIVRRSAEMLNNLKAVEGQLRDPESQEEQQPVYAQNEFRSVNPEILVMIGRCTHLGCSPSYRPDYPAQDLGADWKGGFFCPCHGSKFDLAGRVYKSVPAPLNMPVPPHRYEGDTTIVVGEDPEVA
ncbi:ubiquinol-cytochrome c reductase, iron-sulfur subunit [Oceanococcus atlanticus]|uniref:Ubiquinol-cytochrome c reductase iron-sulfur subunit n=1 Tax=Oceanococcus atlanticus TaxID=1317117 RepID=A0A1Y1SBI7_9GAMM|nr:ubiquinol-cytochrome c reductase iron-sulfur subunit [Oceanococcus atlanticus]ORE85473.1 ubiquinol-cytochrome c reductase, iron-sulfur subunit [Oceanococcus atlanticus]RZO84610.1 MAG: ubiquinol-cytochrome c reductase iron-sulfur subunit [Oceanococcus sp.]